MTTQIPNFSTTPTSGDIKPTKVGCYKRVNPQHPESYSYWDGDRWLSFRRTYTEANDPSDNVSYKQDWDWYDIVEDTPPFVAMKFHTPTKEINLAVQDKLDELGYAWGSGHKGWGSQYTYLVTDAHGNIMWNSAFESNHLNFVNAPEIEVKLNVKTTVEVSFDVPVREVIEIAGKKYFLDDVVKNISGCAEA